MDTQQTQEKICSQTTDEVLAVLLGQTNVDGIGCPKDPCSNVGGYGLYIDEITEKSFKLLNGFGENIKIFNFSENIKIKYEERSINGASYGYLIFPEYSSKNVSDLKKIKLNIESVSSGLGSVSPSIDNFINAIKNLFSE
jgi:hypothetical protein